MTKFSEPTRFPSGFTVSRRELLKGLGMTGSLLSAPALSLASSSGVHGARWNINCDTMFIDRGFVSPVHQGQVADLAIQFYGWDAYENPFGESKIEERRASSMEGVRYRVNAQVLYASKALWLMDCGLVVFSNQPPPRYVKAGSWVAGEISFGLPDCDVKHLASMDKGIPSITNRVQIEQVLLHSTPYQTGIKNGRQVRYRDTTVKQWTAVEKTQPTVPGLDNDEYMLVVKSLSS
ncbi:hypothetical protein [Ottowia sp.]|uniref:hypothetical protein n=1 Tax=Ottowia sp. TaxID=1898956 RepID=UPI0039E228E8